MSQLETGVASSFHPAYERPRVLFVAHPFHPLPTGLSRVWCLFELFVASTLQSRVDLALSNEARDQFATAGGGGYDDAIAAAEGTLATFY